MPLRPTCDVFVCAGEASGDAYGAAVVQALRERDPGLEIAGMGGPRMAAAGVDLVHGIDGLAVMGLFPVLARLPTFIRLGLHIAGEIQARRPRVVVTIDYPGFHFRLLRRLQPLRAQGVRLVHVVAPQVWAWRQRRAKSIAQTVDRLLCFFPFEPAYFTRFGGTADFVGHPLVDLVQPLTAQPGDFGLDNDAGGRLGSDARLLLLAPGSRTREVEHMLPIYHQAAMAMLARCRAKGGPPVQAVVSKVPDLPLSLYRAHTDLPLVEGRYRELLAAAQVAFIASGTATLEAAIMGTPHVIAYRKHRIEAAIVRQILQVKHVGLPNLVVGRRICPELLQDELTVPRLVAHGERLWDGPARIRQQEAFAEVRQRLGGPGAISRMVDMIHEDLRRARRGQDRITGMTP